MKYILTSFIALCIFQNADAQSSALEKPQGTVFTNDGYVISCGGGLVTAGGGGFGGSASVGLPFVGIINQSGGLECKLGLYVNLKKTGTNAVPLSKTERITANIYPNPTQGDVTINLSPDIGAPIRVMLYDEHGGELGEVKYSFDGEKLLMQIPNRAAGIYFLRVEGKNFAQAYKFTIVK